MNAQAAGQPSGVFFRRDDGLACEGVALAEVAARFGTPTYVYSRAAIEGAFAAYTTALRGRPSLVCYAMKANPNLAVLDLLARAGSGFDIVSGGELARVIAAGGDPRRRSCASISSRWPSWRWSAGWPRPRAGAPGSRCA